MSRTSSTGLPFLVRRADTGKFCYHRDVPAAVAPFVTGEVELTWKESIHKLEGRPTVKVSLATGDEATARVRWNRVHEQVEGLVQMGRVLAAEKERRDRQRQIAERLPDRRRRHHGGAGPARPASRARSDLDRPHLHLAPDEASLCG